MGTAFRSLPTGNKHKCGYFFGFLKKGRQPRGPPFISSPYQHAFLAFSRTKREQAGLMQTCSGFVLLKTKGNQVGVPSSLSRAKAYVTLPSQTIRRKQAGLFELEKEN